MNWDWKTLLAQIWAIAVLAAYIYYNDLVFRLLSSGYRVFGILASMLGLPSI